MKRACLRGVGGAEMRWLAAAFFFAIAAGFVVLAWWGVQYGLISAEERSDAGVGGIIIGILFMLGLAGGAVFGGLWVLRHWPPRSSTRR